GLYAGQVAIGYLGQTLAVVGVSLVEERQHVVLGVVLGTGQSLAQAVDQVALFLAGEGAVQITGLLEVLLLVDRLLHGSARHRELAVAGRFRLRTRLQTARLVVHLTGAGAGVHRTVLVVVVHRHLGLVDRQVLVVGAQAVHLGVGVAEQAALQHAV